MSTILQNRESLITFVKAHICKTCEHSDDGNQCPCHMDDGIYAIPSEAFVDIQKKEKHGN